MSYCSRSYDGSQPWDCEITTDPDRRTRFRTSFKTINCIHVCEIHMLLCMRYVKNISNSLPKSLKLFIRQSTLQASVSSRQEVRQVSGVG